MAWFLRFRQAQAAFQFEEDTNSQLITFNYWDSLYKGLLAGESLMLSLQQMETSYNNLNTRTFEIEKTISVQQHFICPMECNFLNEITRRHT